MLSLPAAATPIIDWDPAYFWEPGANPISSIATSEMKIVGTISAFGPPLSFLNANILAGTEYTFYVSGLISNGTTSYAPFYITTYTGGTIAVYEDATPDAVFDPNPPNGNVPSTFTDGTLILSGNISNFNTQTNTSTVHNTGNAEGNITWTGGSLIAYVGGDNPCPAIFTGGLTWYPGTVITGYLFRHDGKIDHECPSPTAPSTWGRIKSLYR
jgi:hypothetical protein